MRKHIYLALKKRLQRLVINDTGKIITASDTILEAFENKGISPDYAIKHIALWNRQTEFMEEENIFAMPAVFLEFGKIEWRHQSGGLQDAELTIGIHVLTSAVPEGYDGDLYHLELLDSINNCLHKFQGDYFSSVVRCASVPCHDHEEILDSTEIFKCVIYDNSAVKELVSIKPVLDINQTK